MLCICELYGVWLYLNKALHIQIVQRISEFLVQFQLQGNVLMDKLEHAFKKGLWHVAGALYVHTVPTYPALAAL